MHTRAWLIFGLLFFFFFSFSACDRSPGRVVSMFDIGGHEAFLYCLGEGDPTVVIDAGAGGNVFSLHDLVADISATTRVCMWDRPGLGVSQDGPIPTDSRQIAGQLRTLLQVAGIPSPYVLVGHSFGGMNLRLFAHRFRHEVAGLVLVDSSHPDQFDRFAAALPPRQPGESIDLRSFRTRDFGNGGVDMEASIVQVRGVTSLGDLPLVVVSRADDPEHMWFPGISKEVAAALHGEWMAMQREHAALSTCGRQVIAERAGHCVHCTEPKLVIDAIHQVLETARNRGELEG